MDFPGGTVDGRLPANARDMGLIRGLGGFHMLQSNWAHEPQPLSPHPRARALQREMPPPWEARAPQRKRSPVLLQLESLPRDEDPAYPKTNK